MNEKDIKKIIRSWFKKKKIIIEDKDNLLKDEILDSFDIIDFISNLEKNFAIKFSTNELQNTNILSINNLTKVIKNKIDE